MNLAIDCRQIEKDFDSKGICQDAAIQVVSNEVMLHSMVFFSYTVLFFDFEVILSCTGQDVPLAAAVEL